ncbi:MAG: four helix bundle protein [Patescibacteria group bacterium]
MWHRFHELLPKTQKYSLGNRIDKLFIENIEATATAAFLPPAEKRPWVRLALRKTDATQVLLQILWETKSLEDKQYIALATELADIGKDLGGWNGKLTKQNSAPTRVGAEK